MPTSLQDGKGLTKQQANYRAAEGGQACAACKNFMPPDKCRVVRDGAIDPQGTCDYFEGEQDTNAIAEMLFGGVNAEPDI